MAACEVDWGGGAKDSIKSCRYAVIDGTMIQMIQAARSFTCSGN